MGASGFNLKTRQSGLRETRTKGLDPGTKAGFRDGITIILKYNMNLLILNQQVYCIIAFLPLAIILWIFHHNIITLAKHSSMKLRLTDIPHIHRCQRSRWVVQPIYRKEATVMFWTVFFAGITYSCCCCLYIHLPVLISTIQLTVGHSHHQTVALNSHCYNIISYHVIIFSGADWFGFHLLKSFNHICFWICLMFQKRRVLFVKIVEYFILDFCFFKGEL